MDEKHLVIPSSKLEEVLLPQLVGEVFHVTPQEAARHILADGVIKNNKNGQFRFIFPQAENSYFRRKGCVCLFDLRSRSQEVIEDALLKYPFLNPTNAVKPVFFLLDKSLCQNLITYADFLNEKSHDTIIIPHVEAGYLGEICLQMISMILWVDLTHADEKNNSLSSAATRPY